MSYYIENIFLCLAVPLILSLLFRKGKQRTFTVFVILGMGSCLLSAYVSSFFAGCYGTDPAVAVMEITPACEEVIKFLPLLFYLLVFEPDRHNIVSPAIELPLDSLLLKMYVILRKMGQRIFPMC